MRFIDNQDGTITDTKTGLMWEKDGSSYTVTWEIANNYSIGTGNYHDWRLPTIEELISLIDFSRYYPAIDPIFKCCSSHYWSGGTTAYSQDYARSVGFNDGFVSTDYKSEDNYVRCVREVK